MSSDQVSSSLPAAVERFDPREVDIQTGAHLSRYRFAAPYAIKGPVLDIACSYGYGTDLLQKSGSQPTFGADLDLHSLRFAANNHRGLKFIGGDAARMPFASHSFMTVVSIETIEHVPDASAVLSEFARILRPGGRLVMTTPNFDFRGHHSGNPFHIHEFRPDELRTLIERDFVVEHLLGQRITRRAHNPFAFGVPIGLPVGTRTDDIAQQSTGSRQLEPLSQRLFARLPLFAKNVVWRTAFRLPYYPSEDEFVFVPELAGAPVMAIVARRI